MLMLGADAVQLGTRFAASTEARLHQAYKQRIVDTPVDGTQTVGQPGKAIRVIPNEFTQEYERLLHAGAPDEAERYFAATSLRQSADQGDVDTGKVEAGQTTGLIHEILPAAVIIEEITREYQEATQRMASFHDKQDQYHEMSSRAC